MIAFIPEYFGGRSLGDSGKLLLLSTLKCSD